MFRQNRRDNIVDKLDKIKGYGQPFTSVKFEDVVYYFKNARNIGFAADAFVQYVEFDGIPMAMKIIKLSVEESDPKYFKNTSNINKLDVSCIKRPRSAGYNIWREVDTLTQCSPEISKCPHFPYFYGFFIAKWGGNMIEDLYMHAHESDEKYRKYLQSREDNKVCIVLLMEMFDYTILSWTERRHTFDEWKSVYTQMLESMNYLCKIDVVHNDTHYKNFLITKVAGDWLVALGDMGSAISTRFQLSKPEVKVYESLKKENRDLSVSLYVFDTFNIAMHHFSKLKRIQVVNEVKRIYPTLIIDIKNRINKSINHTIFWIALAEVMASNLEHFNNMIDIDKLPPHAIQEYLDIEYTKINKGKKYDIQKLIDGISNIKESS